MRRHELYQLVFVTGLMNAMIRPILTNIGEFGLYESIIQGFGISFIVWFSIYCALDLIGQARKIQATKQDWVTALLTLILLCIPSAFISWTILTGYAITCALGGAKMGTPLRAGCIIMAAIALRVPLSDICLKLSADALLQLDALSTLIMGKVLMIDIVRQGNILIGPEGHEVLIMTGCASFTNISLALLLWFTILRTKIMRWQRHFILYGVFLCACVMAINIFRLSMMTVSREYYTYYHDGLGADLINAGILLSALVIAMIGVIRERHEETGYVH